MVSTLVVTDPLRTVIITTVLKGSDMACAIYVRLRCLLGTEMVAFPFTPFVATLRENILAN